ncbi:MAG: SusC/RagA family TonB-linked outer membrane protein [Arachidicoccus sp.]|nr:SusC/RagA family TonB-linked outer membrane protein [Arachidicoccus sp.]
MKKILFSTIGYLIILIFIIFPIYSFSQAISSVHGIVQSAENNTPLAGVTVKNLTTNKIVITNAAGYFQINSDSLSFLQFTFVGCVSQTIQAKMLPSAIKLLANDKDLNEVVIVGYGQSKNKRELSYQAPTVSGEDIAQTRRTNFLNALEGRVPGLTVTATSGLPGSSASVMLRGGSSIGGNNQPLFVIDGVPVDNSSINQNDLLGSSTSAIALANRNNDYTNRIADLNPEDIESITVLKGPEAAAMYGSDGASGAIVITTKKGFVGAPQINYDNSFAVSEVYRFPHIQQKYEMGQNGIYDPTSSDYGTYGYFFFGPEYPDTTKFYNNIKNFFRKSFDQQHDLSMGAGNKDLNYRLSMGYTNQNGVVPNTNLIRYNFRFSGFAQVTKWLTMATTFSYVYSTNNKATKGAGSFYTNLMTFPQDIDGRDYENPDGTRKTIGNQSLTSQLDNPFWDVNKNRSADYTHNITGNINLQANIAKGLTATSIVGLNTYTSTGYMVYNPSSYYAASLNGFISTYESVFKGLNGTFRLNYINRIKNTITNNFYLGAYFEDNQTKTNAQRGESFYEPNFVSINNTDPTKRLASISQNEVRKLRFYAGYTFNYKDLVYITATGTREGTSTLTSKFQDLQPFYNYASISGSYILSDMPFMKPLKSWLSFAKLRASYASTGKGPLAPYIIDYSFNSVTSTGGGYALGYTGNNFNLKPEHSKNLELGGQIDFFNDRLGIDAAWFHNRVTDNIISQRISYASGYLLKWLNGGTLGAHGWEIQLTASPIKQKNFIWNTIVNFDKSKTIVESLPLGMPFYYTSDANVFGSVRSQVGVGQSLANLSGYDFVRNNKGQLLISPTTGLPTEDVTDYVPIGDRQPDFKIGWINSFTYKGWNLEFNLDIRKGGDVFNANEEMMTINGISTRTLDRDKPRVIQGVLQDGLENTDHPTKNTIAITPYYRSTYYDGNIAESDYIENVNWLRLEDITLSYALPNSLIKKQNILKAASVYITATDVFMITNYTGMDPNVNAITSSNAAGYGGSGIDYGSIPNPRTINFGLRVSF